MINTILEILRYKFPVVVADIIFYFYISDINLSLKNELIKKAYTIGINGILKIHYTQPAFWIINYEKDYLNRNKYTSKNLENYNVERNYILKRNHFFFKGYKKRCRAKYSLR